MNIIQLFSQLLGLGQQSLPTKLDAKALDKLDFASILKEKGFTGKEIQQFSQLLDARNNQRTATLSGSGMKVSIEFPQALIQKNEQLFVKLKQKVAALPEAQDVQHKWLQSDKPARFGVNPAAVSLQNETTNKSTKNKSTELGSNHLNKPVDTKQGIQPNKITLTEQTKSSLNQASEKQNQLQPSKDDSKTVKTSEVTIEKKSSDNLRLPSSIEHLTTKEAKNNSSGSQPLTISPSDHNQQKSSSPIPAQTVAHTPDLKKKESATIARPLQPTNSAEPTTKKHAVTADSIEINAQDKVTAKQQQIEPKENSISVNSSVSAEQASLAEPIPSKDPKSIPNSSESIATNQSKSAPQKAQTATPASQTANNAVPFDKKEAVSTPNSSKLNTKDKITAKQQQIEPKEASISVNSSVSAEQASLAEPISSKDPKSIPNSSESIATNQSKNAPQKAQTTTPASQTANNAVPFNNKQTRPTAESVEINAQDKVTAKQQQIEPKENSISVNSSVSAEQASLAEPIPSKDPKSIPNSSESIATNQSRNAPQKAQTTTPASQTANNAVPFDKKEAVSTPNSSKLNTKDKITAKQQQIEPKENSISVNSSVSAEQASLAEPIPSKDPKSIPNSSESIATNQSKNAPQKAQTTTPASQTANNAVPFNNKQTRPTADSVEINAQDTITAKQQQIEPKENSISVNSSVSAEQASLAEPIPSKDPKSIPNSSESIATNQSKNAPQKAQTTTPASQTANNAVPFNNKQTRPTADSVEINAKDKNTIKQEVSRNVSHRIGTDQLAEKTSFSTKNLENNPSLNSEPSSNKQTAKELSSTSVIKTSNDPSETAKNSPVSKLNDVTQQKVQPNNDQERAYKVNRSIVDHENLTAISTKKVERPEVPSIRLFKSEQIADERVATAKNVHVIEWDARKWVQKTESQKPIAHSQQPIAESLKTNTQPESHKPIAHSQLPTANSQAESHKPTANSQQPIANSQLPIAESSKTYAQTDSQKPTAHSQLPIANSQIDSSKPTAQNQQPIANSQIDSSKPTAHSQQPIANNQSESPKPIANSQTDSPKPTAQNQQPIANSQFESPKPTVNSQQPIANNQTDSPKPITNSQQPIAESSKTNSQPESPKPTAHSQKPTAHSQQPTANSQSESPKPTVNSQQPIADSQKPTAHSQQPIANNNIVDDTKAQSDRVSQQQLWNKELSHKMEQKSIKEDLRSTQDQTAKINVETATTKDQSGSFSDGNNSPTNYQSLFGQAQATEDALKKTGNTEFSDKLEQNISGTTNLNESGKSTEARLPNNPTVSRMQDELLRSLRMEEQRDWHRQRIVMDDGNSLNFNLRKQGDLIQIQLLGGQNELGRLLQQHAGEIRQHIEQQLNLKLDLQFGQGNTQDNSSNTQQNNQQSSSAKTNRQGFGNTTIESNLKTDSNQAHAQNGWIG